MEGRARAQTRIRVHVVEHGVATLQRDLLATEEPLEIRVRAGESTDPLVVTMRTPGSDFELAAGFLFSEGVITDREQIRRIEYCVENELDGAQQYNIVTVELRDGASCRIDKIGRRFGITSACGVCGKESLDQVERMGIASVSPGPVVTPDLIEHLPEALRAGQSVFMKTGGLHAAALFTSDGKLLAIREDVGRHNAVDKLVGWALLEGRLPLADHLVLVSGRSSFEIAQKCAAAGVPILCAVSAPSSLAVDLARRFNMTLIGFLRGNRFNIYAGAERINLSAQSSR